LAGRGSEVNTLIKTIGIALVGLLVVGGTVVLGARWLYGPLGPIPGPELAGSVVTEPVDDWSFVDAIKVVQVETRPEDPYSVSTWLTRTDDGIYVFAGNEESPWVQNIAEDSRVRIRIEGRIHELRAMSVANLETKRVFLTNMKSKYECDFGFDPTFWQHGWDTGDFVLFRLEPR
jgi:hypothetical protein